MNTFNKILIAVDEEKALEMEIEGFGTFYMPKKEGNITLSRPQWGTVMEDTPNFKKGEVVIFDSSVSDDVCQWNVDGTIYIGGRTHIGEQCVYVCPHKDLIYGKIENGVVVGYNRVVCTPYQEEDEIHSNVITQMAHLSAHKATVHHSDKFKEGETIFFRHGSNYNITIGKTEYYFIRLDRIMKGDDYINPEYVTMEALDDDDSLNTKKGNLLVSNSIGKQLQGRVINPNGMDEVNSGDVVYYVKRRTKQCIEGVYYVKKNEILAIVDQEHA